MGFGGDLEVDFFFFVYTSPGHSISLTGQSASIPASASPALSFPISYSSSSLPAVPKSKQNIKNDEKSAWTRDG